MTDQTPPQCDNCGSANVSVGVRIRHIGRLPSQTSAAEGQWYHCEKCGRRWFVPDKRAGEASA